ncbi:MAG: aspartate carbamoyltransferase [Methylomicrobium sp.]
MKTHVLIISLSAALLMAASALAADKATENRLDEVAKRGAHVMPFSLEQTTHIFSKTEKGGLQQVIVKNNSNTGQIGLIRQHLSKISQEFMRGDFSDPAMIHDEDMPGLAELRKAPPGRIKIVYKELPNGAKIDYSTDDRQLIDAIHRWFDAQLSDHARHAMPGHPHHQMHHNP